MQRVIPLDKRYIDTLLFPNKCGLIFNVHYEYENTIKLTKKSDKDVYFQHLRLVLFGIATVGAMDLEFSSFFLF